MIAIFCVAFALCAVYMLIAIILAVLSDSHLTESPYDGVALWSKWYFRVCLWLVVFYGSFYAFDSQLLSLSILTLIVSLEVSYFVGYRRVLFGKIISFAEGK